MKALRDLETRHAERARRDVRRRRDICDDRVREPQALAPRVHQLPQVLRILVAEIVQDLAEIERVGVDDRPDPDRRSLARNLGRAFEIGARLEFPQQKTHLVAVRAHHARDRQQGGEMPGVPAQFPGEIDARHDRRVAETQSPPNGGP